MPEAIDNEFLGVNKNTPPPRLAPGMFQEDVGGDRYSLGSWKRRRGMRRTDQDKLPNAVVSMIGFEMPGGDFAMLAVAGTEIHGFVNVSQQA